MDAASRESFEHAVTLMGEGDLEQGAALLEEVVEDAPEVTAPYIDLALALERLDRPEDAEQYLQMALRLFPGHPVASNEYGLLLRKAGRFLEARTVYEESLVSFPEYMPAHRNLGILCDLYLDDPACAMEQYEIYSEAMPKDEQVAVWIADLRLRSEKGN
jgi:Tfp pilus assembly protein PilF